MDDENKSYESRITPETVKFVQMSDEELKKGYKERKKEMLENLKEFLKRDLKEAEEEESEELTK